jgi:hypothetical protein
MPLLGELKLLPSKVNDSVDELIAFSRVMEDVALQEMFADVGRGWAYPQGTPTPDEVPQLRFWYDLEEIANDSTNFSCDDMELTISCFFYFYADEHEGDIQAARHAFIQHWLRRLRAPMDSEVAGSLQFSPVNFKFVAPQNVTIDHTSPFKRIADYIPIKPHPWYVTRVDLKIYVGNIASYNPA